LAEREEKQEEAEKHGVGGEADKKGCRFPNRTKGEGPETTTGIEPLSITGKEGTNQRRASSEEMQTKKTEEGGGINEEADDGFHL